MRFVLYIQYVAIVGMRTELPCSPTRAWANVGRHAARPWAAATCLAVGAARKRREMSATGRESLPVASTAITAAHQQRPAKTQDK